MMRRIIPLFFFGPAINFIKEGDVGLGIAMLSGSALLIIVNAFFDDEMERRYRERR